MFVPPLEIFKAYDIRGIVDKTLTAEVCPRHRPRPRFRSRRPQPVASGHRRRPTDAPVRPGLASAPPTASAPPVDVIDVAACPPLTYFAAYELGTNSCVSVTGSHNPPDYNGLKMVLGGQTLFGDTIQALRQRIIGRATCHRRQPGSSPRPTWCPALRPQRSSATSSWLPPDEDRDGLRQRRGRRGGTRSSSSAWAARAGRAVLRSRRQLPNHHPDPSKPGKPADVIHAVRETDAEIGLAFDGDGDRLGVVTKDGESSSRPPADAVCRRRALACAGRRDHLRRQMHPQPGWLDHRPRRQAHHVEHRPRAGQGQAQETGAPLAGEMSGHVFFKERWYGFDDGLYAPAPACSRSCPPRRRQPGAQGPMPDAVQHPELNIKMNEGEPFALVDKLVKAEAKFEGAESILTIDGVRRIRRRLRPGPPVQHHPVVVLRFEVDNEAAIARIQADFRRAIEGVCHVQLPSEARLRAPLQCKRPGG